MRTVLTSFLLTLATCTMAQGTKEVPASGIGSGYTLIGLLGRPLGTIVTIECRGITPTKDELLLKAADWEHQVEVVKVDGSALAKPVRIDWSSLPWAEVQMPKGTEEVSVIGYEDGGFVGIPDKAFDYVPQAQDDGYYFRTVFIALKLQKSAHQLTGATDPAVTNPKGSR